MNSSTKIAIDDMFITATVTEELPEWAKENFSEMVLGKISKDRVRRIMVRNESNNKHFVIIPMQDAHRFVKKNSLSLEELLLKMTRR